MTTHEELATRLHGAYRNGPVAPLRDGLAPGDVAGAYSVQALTVRRWRAAGRTVVGRKIGLTAEAVRAQFKVDQPDFGVLTADMEIEDGGILPAARVIQPKAEAEVALVLKEGLDSANLSLDRVAAAVESACTAIEIVDSRIAGWDITLADTIADNGSSAFFVRGGDRRPLAGLDLYSCGMVLEVNGTVRSVGAGAACMGHPLIATQWLARTMREVGEPLAAGDVVLTGSLGPIVTLARGDSVRAVVGGLGSCGFTYEPA